MGSYILKKWEKWIESQSFHMKIFKLPPSFKSISYSHPVSYLSTKFFQEWSVT